jgi:hypothetical protein
MSPSRLSPPQQLDIVPASEVGSILEQTDRDFVELERVHEETRAEAEEAEALAAAEGVDPKSSTWTMVRLQRFLDGLREEATRDASATVEVAQQRARVRLEEAHEEAERRRLGYDPDPLVPPIRLTEPPAAPVPPVAPHTPVVPVVAPQAPVVEAPSVVAPLVTAPEPVKPPLAIDGSTFVTSPAASAPAAANESTNHHGAAVAGAAAAGVAGGALLLASPATAAPTVPPMPPMPTAGPSLVQPSPAVAAEPFAGATVAGSDVVTAAPNGDAPSFVDEQFWTPVAPATAAAAAAGAAAVAAPAAPTVAPDVDTKQGRRARHQQEKAAKQAEQAAAKAAEPAPAPKAAKPAKQGFLHRIPVTAILEVLAVLLILVFILLRLS